MSTHSIAHLLIHWAVNLFAFIASICSTIILGFFAAGLVEVHENGLRPLRLPPPDMVADFCWALSLVHSFAVFVSFCAMPRFTGDPSVDFIQIIICDLLCIFGLIVIAECFALGNALWARFWQPSRGRIIMDKDGREGVNNLKMATCPLCHATTVSGGKYEEVKSKIGLV